tara:strand:+ start:121 stop:684 length:564 start_codon:yes stop_codon:yes gene_type:complete
MYWIDGEPVAKGVIRTGDINAKTKSKGVTYLDGVDERIRFVCEGIEEEVRTHYKAMYTDYIICIPIVLEGLSFGSAGNATRDLAGLYYTLKYSLEESEISCYKKMYTYVPTSIKALARDYLPEAEQTVISPKTSKPIKVKMDKKLMVKACQEVMGVDFLKGYNYSTGLDDIVDAYWLGKLYMIKEKK